MILGMRRDCVWIVDYCACELPQLPSGHYSFAQLSKLCCKDDNGICLSNAYILASFAADISAAGAEIDAELAESGRYFRCGSAVA